jgi:hypothetical protein
MKRAALAAGLVVLIGLLATPVASGAFGFKELDSTFTNEDGSAATQAGSHPFEQTTVIALDTIPDDALGEVPVGETKDLIVTLPPGLVGKPTVVARCSTADFFGMLEADGAECPASSQIGTTEVSYSAPELLELRPVYSLEPPPGSAMRLGFIAGTVPVTVDIGIKEEPPYNVVATSRNIDNPVNFYSASLSVWGVPSDSAHDAEREGAGCAEDGCSVNLSREPFLTLPRACTGPLATRFEAFSWAEPAGPPAVGTVLSHDGSDPPNPLGMTGCPKLAFNPSIAAQPTARAASSPTGMDVSLTVDDEGLTSPEGLAQSDIRKAVVTLPEGMTANPSVAEGLEVCSEAQLAAETAFSAPGEGCPEASKIGTVEVRTPLLEETVNGALYQATPYANLAGDSLIGLYVVIRNRNLGIVVKQPIRVEADPRTGQLRGIAEDIPQLPFSSFKLHFREGGRSPLISPPGCGTHRVEAELTPWAGGAPLSTSSTFELIAGPEGRSCPGGVAPFEPGFEAGTLNNAAGTHSPFHMRWTRRDGDQDITRFAAQLPPGVVAKLAGTAQCPQASIEAAKARTGLAERAQPSCPASSEIGSVLTGAGVGSQLTYVPGKVYLAGPYHGAPLSAVGIVPAVAGPFDVGTVVTQQALRIDPRTGEVTADGSSSDPIPHILAGIPLKVRDIRVSVDKPSFTLNPTSCDPSQVGAQLWGSGSDLFGLADDRPVPLSSRFQAAGCASLGFKPRLRLALHGGTKRGGHPSLRGEYRPRPGDANLEDLVLRLPRSAFLDQAHIRTICTRVQFAQEACPPGAVYGHATAYTPLLEEPLSGPIYLRSSSNELPDFVADLKGLVDVEAVARIDSVRGGIRATFEDVPDAPLAKVVVRMRGGRKGLIVNSTDLCRGKRRADLLMSAHNGKRAKGKPLVKASGCGKGGRTGNARRR